jgi:hypothetical protein
MLVFLFVILLTFSITILSLFSTVGVKQNASNELEGFCMETFDYTSKKLVSIGVLDKMMDMEIKQIIHESSDTLAKEGQKGQTM